MAKYLNEDVTSSFFGPESTIKRVSAHSEILEHSGCVTEMLARLDGGYCLEEVEPGLVYLVEDLSSLSEDGIKAVTSLCNAPPIVFFLNQMKWDPAAYVPFSLTLRRPEALFAFYEGEIGVIVAFDPSRFISRLRSFGVVGEFIDDDEYAVEVRAAKDGSTARVSRHFFNRVATEFVSLDWMARECASWALRARGDGVSAV